MFESDRFIAECLDVPAESRASWRRVASDVAGSASEVWLTTDGEIVKLSAATPPFTDLWFSGGEPTLRAGRPPT